MIPSGANFVLLDGQHGCRGADSMIQGIAAGTLPMAGVSFYSYTRMGQLLDAGVLGIVVPVVDKVEQAQAVDAACRNTGKIPGIDIGAPNQAALRAKQGFRFILMGSDSRLLTGAAVSGLKMAISAVG
jgi:2-keto-3-deoxy-L-rhamnonate aldolase RhmA